MVHKVLHSNLVDVLRRLLSRHSGSMDAEHREHMTRHVELAAGAQSFNRRAGKKLAAARDAEKVGCFDRRMLCPVGVSMIEDRFALKRDRKLARAYALVVHEFTHTLIECGQPGRVRPGNSPRWTVITPQSRTTKDKCRCTGT